MKFKTRVCKPLQSALQGLIYLTNCSGFTEVSGEGKHGPCSHSSRGPCWEGILRASPHSSHLLTVSPKGTRWLAHTFSSRVGKAVHRAEKSMNPVEDPLQRTLWGVPTIFPDLVSTAMLKVRLPWMGHSQACKDGTWIWQHCFSQGINKGHRGGGWCHSNYLLLWHWHGPNSKGHCRLWLLPSFFFIVQFLKKMGQELKTLCDFTVGDHPNEC
jgi:hypothetical protein